MVALASLGIRTALMVHVMPWFAAPPISTEFGWHWTMGKTDASKGRLASSFHPLGGPYDSTDPDVIERQTLLMKVAGFDGMLVDWYGDVDRLDYGFNHRATDQLFNEARRAGLTFALVYEDQTVPQLISAGAFRKEDAVAEGKALLARAKARWFDSPTYQRVGGKPLFLVFGPQFYPAEAWKSILPDVAFYTLHARRAGAGGAYDWPLPGPEWMAKRRMLAPGITLPVAFPRFRDYYREAGLAKETREIPDADGASYERTLLEALNRKSPVVQVATWNDWGEGTQVEPSVEFGYRDLETTQRVRRRFEPEFGFQPEDLRLPMRIFALRKLGADTVKIDASVASLRKGRGREAAEMVTALE